MNIPKKKEVVGELSKLKSYKYTFSDLYIDNNPLDIEELLEEFLNRKVKITIEAVESEE